MEQLVEEKSLPSSVTVTKDSPSTTPKTGSAPSVLWPKERWPSQRFLWPLKAQQLKRSNLPILVGPWTSEVGFEALYWLPWLDYFASAAAIPHTRLVPITRGGAATWYGADRGIELLAMRSTQDLRVEAKIRHRETGLLKQTRLRPFEQSIYEDTAKTLGLKRYQTLHPSWMYETLQPFWEGHRGLAWVQQRLRFTELARPELPDGLELPKEFAAVRFYFRGTYPANQLTIDFAKACIAKVAKECPVILLNPDVAADDHADFEMKNLPPNVTYLRDMCSVTPENNLAVQSAVISRSLGFVGTYGGLAQLALRFRKPVISFYQEWHGTMLAHKHLSEALAMQMGVPFGVFRLHDLPLQQITIPTMMANK